MSEPADPIQALAFMAEQAAQGMRRTEAAILEASQPPLYEYLMCHWDDVNEHGREGWQLMPMGPVFAIKGNGVGWVMRRQLGAADEAAEILRET